MVPNVMRGMANRFPGGILQYYTIVQPGIEAKLLSSAVRTEFTALFFT